MRLHYPSLDVRINDNTGSTVMSVESTLAIYGNTRTKMILATFTSAINSNSKNSL